MKAHYPFFFFLNECNIVNYKPEHYNKNEILPYIAYRGHKDIDHIKGLITQGKKTLKKA